MRIAPAELLDPAGDVGDGVDPGVERMRVAGDVDGDERVLVAVGPGDGRRRCRRRSGEELLARRTVADDDGVVIGVDALLHVGAFR